MVPVNPIADAVRFFIGNGTATNPNAGVLIGNGFNFDATSCTGGTACNGGSGGLIGNGGNGFNGGKWRLRRDGSQRRRRR